MALRPSYTRRALRALRRIPPPQARRIRAAVDACAADPQGQGHDGKALQGRQGLRLRVGEYRVIMDPQGAVLAVLDVGPGGSIC
ncbi:type II toxin-antitoxin system RelE family toxin [Jannaschia formosa]|uniref:type II toxin-antitoxin system RelE family toxin n=1 Tax=Jannaschia formosa TaxID=2259592 RepID=UPI000E1BB990|nr:type II toxin-antitoxin system RelE/ParE family toxin [Jannaschia formosa]TFL18690.1 type II toxin-antitoxin system RelE/ParE family toxin [Jannaschia formosa]